MNRKGISEVVTVILIILLSVAAIIIVWQVVKPLIERPASSAQTDCVTVSLEITSASKAAGTVIVKRSPGAGDLTAIEVVTYDSAGSVAYECPSSAIAELASKTCDVSGTGNSATGTWTKAEAYAKVGDDKTLCPNFVKKETGLT